MSEHKVKDNVHNSCFLFIEQKLRKSQKPNKGHICALISFHYINIDSMKKIKILYRCLGTHFHRFSFYSIHRYNTCTYYKTQQCTINFDRVFEIMVTETREKMEKLKVFKIAHWDYWKIVLDKNISNNYRIIIIALCYYMLHVC